MSNKFKRYLQKAYVKCREKFTLMIIPHSEKNIKTFYLRNIYLYLFLLVSGLLFIFLTVYLTHQAIVMKEYFRLEKYTAINKQNLNIYSNEIRCCDRALHKLEKEMHKFNDFKKDNFRFHYGIGGREIDPAAASRQNMTAEKANNNSQKMLVRQMDFLRNSKALSKDLHSFIQKRRKSLQTFPTTWPLLESSGKMLSIPDRYRYTAIECQPAAPVWATGNGLIKNITLTDQGFYKITQQLNFGFTIIYSGLTSVCAEKGKRVKKREKLGCSGPVLFYRIKIADKYFSPADFRTVPR